MALTLGPILADAGIDLAQAIAIRHAYTTETGGIQAIIDRVDADNEYIDTWSFGLDMKIVWRTIPLIFSDTRAY